MDDCCEAKANELDLIRARHGRVLVAVLAINALMFIVEFVAGVVSHSSALLADSLDMLGDSFVYGFSLFVVHRSLTWKARAALLKGGIMALFGAAVLAEVAFKLQSAAAPQVPTMAAIGMLALAANVLCFVLLWRHRADDINFRSTWLCSRNDLIANVAVLAAAALVAWSGSGWPDILVGLGIAILFLRTAAGVLRESFAELGRARDRVLEGAG
jgi:cation diffusion facilitator family transporter